MIARIARWLIVVILGGIVLAWAFRPQPGRFVVTERHVLLPGPSGGREVHRLILLDSQTGEVWQWRSRDEKWKSLGRSWGSG